MQSSIPALDNLWGCQLHEAAQRVEGQSGTYTNLFNSSPPPLPFESLILPPHFLISDSLLILAGLLKHLPYSFTVDIRNLERMNRQKSNWLTISSHSQRGQPKLRDQSAGCLRSSEGSPKGREKSLAGSTIQSRTWTLE